MLEDRGGAADTTTRIRSALLPAMSPPNASDTVLAAPRLSRLHRSRRFVATPANWLQLVQFGVVGASGFAVNLVVYATCLKVFSLHYLASAVVAFAVAVTNNFFWNRHWTFRHRRDRRHAALQGARFLFVSALALIPNLILLHLFVSAGVGKVLAQVLAVCLVVPVSFLGNKLWSFN
jgi:dolichol-phosphate mannosyltransferase